MTNTHSNYFIGIVFICPTTNKQVAMHKNNVTFEYWDSTGWKDIDMKIKKCPSCNNDHILSIPLPS